MRLRPNSSTRASSGVIVAHLTPTPCCLIAFGRVDGDLVVGRVALLDPEVEVLQVDVEVGEDQLLLDERPDDAGHLVAVELDDGVLHLDLASWVSVSLGRREEGRVVASPPDPPHTGDEHVTDKKPVRVAVTGAAGQIGYSLLFRIASGQLLGPDQPVRAAAARDHAGAESRRGRDHGARRLRLPAARRRRGDRRPERRVRRRERRAARRRAPAQQRAWSAPTCWRPTAASSSRRARRSTRTPPTTSRCSSSATRRTRTR